ncbi:hypothetical protein BGI41_06515 [Methanobrevibacter sp. 87.7]|uniref:HAD family hydrolase n=1 Tax=Methanobrevibacter sp. 87.7 TaxID=387957 RepID=UPI000B504FF4|nr:HAD family hydrolase [Methanobrevibacter sp. 87.7]OWT32661.1 hypothetical protein BGI41_06515 [Methanobrevibacter sp. 87.7]
MKKAYIFDFDGTIANTFADSLIAFNKALVEYDYPTLALSNLDNIDYLDFRNFIKSLKDIVNVEDIPKLQLSYKNNFLNGANRHTELYPGIKEVLKTLEDRNINLSICSNRDQELLEFLTDSLLSDIHFSHIVGYVKNEPSKPNPYKLFKIAESENINMNEVLYFGDRSADILTAQNASIDMVLVSWGQTDDIASTCNYPIRIIDKPSEILDL